MFHPVARRPGTRGGTSAGFQPDRLRRSARLPSLPSINPGLVATERIERRYRERTAAELGDAGGWRELTASMPFGRPAEAAEIAAAVAFLASPRSAYTVDRDGPYQLGPADVVCP